MDSFDFWPILVAAIAAFAIGSLWYSPVLFGKEWMALSGLSGADIAESAKKGMWKLYFVQFITALVTFSVLGFIIATVSGRTAGDGIFLAFIAWLGFPAMAGVTELLWSKKPFKLVVISTACTLVTWLVGGAIIGAWN